MAEQVNECWHGYGMDRFCPICDMVELAMSDPAQPPQEGGD